MGTDLSSTAGEAPEENQLSGPQLREMYYLVRTARVLNERMNILNRQGTAPFVIAGIGQEGAQVGAALALDRTRDYLAPYYRDLGMNLVFGMSPREAMLNLFAKRDDPNGHGRQMPAHWGDAKRRVVTQSSVVATQLLHAAGIAFAAKLKDDPIVVMACCGEGSTSRGDFHEALNFAAIHRLAVIFFVENNGYAISERPEKEMPVPRVADRAQAYGITGTTVDGMDAMAVYETVRAAVVRARRGSGPALIEALCYRLGPHSSDDDDRRYRSRDEVERWALKDPVKVLANRLVTAGVCDREALSEIDERVKEEVDEAVAWARAEPDPLPEDTLTFVFAGGPR